MNYSDEERVLAPENGEVRGARLAMNGAPVLANSRLGKALAAIGSAATRLHGYRNLHTATLYRALCDVDRWDCR